MKNIRFISIGLAIFFIVSVLAGCSAMSPEDGGADGLNGGNNMNPETSAWGERVPEDAEAGDLVVPAEGELVENPFLLVDKAPTSTFSADVDTASYAYFRKLVSQNYGLEALQAQLKNSPLRTEELINYFDYSVNLPAEGEKFGLKTTVAKTPWNDSTHLLIMNIATEQVVEKGANNLVFLIDVSGSMSSSDKLPLLKGAFENLVSALDENDRVSIVTYSGKEAVVLSGCAGNRDEEIMNAINSLTASGSTNGEAGLTRAYSLAKDYFIEGGNNRIIMASDGDLNVGISSVEELKNYISGKRDEGIFLSVLGFGTGNYKDDKMSTLAQNGNGVYYYIDSAREAEKVLGTDLLSTLYTVAKDVKFQITFDGTNVEKYRLIGYETRMLNTEDFEDDTKDAGEVGAGHIVTVCYEIGMKAEAEGQTDGIAKLDMRYKEPDGTESQLVTHDIKKAVITDTPDSDFKFISAVIETVMILNGSQYNAKKVTLEDALSLIYEADISSDVYKTEFKTMLEKLNGGQ